MGTQADAHDHRLRHPDQRHLRRAADAVAGRDSNSPAHVLVELRKSPAFSVRVIEDEAEANTQLQALNAAAAGDTSLPFWCRIPCQGEPSAFNRAELERGLNLILHDWWSPLVPIRLNDVDRDDIGDYVLTITSQSDKTKVIATVNLTQELRRRLGEPSEPGSRGNSAELAQLDAVFFTFEAADKFLMPQLATTYGVKGGWQMRNELKRQLGDQLVSDLDEPMRAV